MSGSAQTFNPSVHDLAEIARALKMLRIQVPLATFNQTAAPTATDDITKSWKIGSKWIDTTHHIVYECSSNAENAAVWQQMVGTNATAGSGGIASSPDLDGTTDYVGVSDVSAGTIVRVILNQLTAAIGAQPLDATLTELAAQDITQGCLLYGVAADDLSVLAKGTAGQVLTMNAGATAPEWAASAGGIPTTITVANEATDTTCFLLFATAATGDLGPKTNANLAYNSNTGALTLGGTSKLLLNDSNAFINASAQGALVIDVGATGAKTITIGATATTTTIGLTAGGDTSLGVSTLTTVKPATTLMVDLGDSTHLFDKLWVGGTFSLKADGAVAMTGVTGLLAITGSVTMSGSLTVATTLGVTGASTLTGAATLQSTLAVTSTSTLTGAVLLNAKITRYNNITTVSNGVPSELATIDLTAVEAAKAAVALYTPAAAGMFRVSVVLTLTTAATTSSVLAGTAAGQQGVSIGFSTGDGSTAITQAIPLLVQAVGTAFVNTSAANVVGTTLIGSVVIYAAASAITYNIGYTSVGATTMKYSIHMKVEAL